MSLTSLRSALQAEKNKTSTSDTPWPPLKRSQNALLRVLPCECLVRYGFGVTTEGLHAKEQICPKLVAVNASKIFGSEICRILQDLLDLNRIYFKILIKDS